MSSFTKAIEEIGVIVLAAGATWVAGPLAGAAVFLGGTAAVNPMAQKTNNTVSPTAWKADPQAGIPYAMGRTFVGGNIVYRQAYGKKNKYQTLVTILSGGGPHEAIETLYVDNVERAIMAGGKVDLGGNTDNMYAATQLGLTPEPSALDVAPVDPFGWTAECKLSGYAASIVTLIYDTKGAHTMTNTPALGWVGKWARVYDPRKDGTYPGGEGAHRIDDETTWEWSENPYLHALTWLIGRRANGQLVLGVGMATSGILIDQLVEGANVADANGWTLGGVVNSTDDKWDAFKKMLQAGGAVPLRLAGRVGCLISTPRISLATIERGDLAGEVSVQATQSRKDRINSIVPRYMGTESVTTEDSDDNLVTSETWTMLPAAPISVAAYVAQDGRTRQREVEYTLVQAPNGAPLTQVGALARYDIENAREFGPIKLPLKLRWYGYKPGDVVTCGASMAEVGLAGQDILLMNRALSPQDGSVTMTARSETFAKHAFALGQTATPPDTPSVSIPDFSSAAPSDGDWTLTGATLTSASGAIPALELTLADGHDVDGSVDAIILSYRTVPILISEAGTPLLAEMGQPILTEGGVPGGWKGATLEAPTLTAKDITEGIVPGTGYQVSIAYRSGSSTSAPLILGPVVAGDLATSRGAYRIVSQSVDYPVSTDDDSITIAAFTGVLDDGRSQIFPAGGVAGLDASINFGLFLQIADSSYLTTPAPSEAQMASKAYVFLGWAATSDGTGVYPTSPTPPGGSGGSGSHPALA